MSPSCTIVARSVLRLKVSHKKTLNAFRASSARTLPCIISERKLCQSRFRAEVECKVHVSHPSFDIAAVHVPLSSSTYAIVLPPPVSCPSYQHPIVRSCVLKLTQLDASYSGSSYLHLNTEKTNISDQPILQTTSMNWP